MDGPVVFFITISVVALISIIVFVVLLSSESFTPKRKFGNNPMVIKPPETGLETTYPSGLEYKRGKHLEDNISIDGVMYTKY